MPLLVLLEIDGKESIVEANHIRPQYFPFCRSRMASNFYSILEELQRHIAITANLQYLKIEFEKLLQALDQVDDLPQIHFSPMQLYLEEVDLQQLQ